MLAALLLSGMAWSAPLSASPSTTTPSPEEKVAANEVKGRVVTITKRAISVEYDSKEQASYEMLLPLAKDIRLSHLQDLSELKQGDTVRVKYEQTYTENDKGERMILKTLATDLTLLRSAPKNSLSSREQLPK